MGCVQYAVKRHCRRWMSDAAQFVGPPLAEREAFGAQGSSPERAREAVLLYRERYQPTGIWECEPYPGMPELLDTLKDAGFRIAVCTSKPDPQRCGSSSATTRGEVRLHLRQRV